MKLYPAFLYASLAAVSLAIARSAQKQSAKDFFAMIAVLGLIFALFYLIAYFLERMPVALDSLALFFNRVMYKEVAVAFAVSGMTPEMLDVFKTRYLLMPEQVLIAVDGVELDPDFVIKTLQKAEAYYPDFPPTRERGDFGSLEKVDEVKKKALRKYLVMTGRLENVDGMRHRWINGADPRNTLEMLGYVE